MSCIKTTLARLLSSRQPCAQCLKITGTAYRGISANSSVVFYPGRSRGVSKVSKNWSDHLWLVFACISLIMSMLPYSFTFMRWKPVINVSRSALATYAPTQRFPAGHFMVHLYSSTRRLRKHITTFSDGLGTRLITSIQNGHKAHCRTTQYKYSNSL